MLRKLLLLFVSIFSIALSSSALELDLSVDEKIRKKYDSKKLEYEVLPNLPNVSPTTSTPPKSQLTYVATTPNITKIDKKDAIKIPSGTKFQAKSNQIISDWSTEGANISFTTTAPTLGKYTTIPSGSTIYGKITETHQPQRTGNGGLIVVQITSITYNGKTYAANGKITKANSKKIFFNNIKGKRQYWANVGKHIDNGETFYKKSRNIANKMSNNPILVVLSPLPTAVGMAGFTICTVLSPISALGTKGKNISIPAGSTYEIKLLDTAYVQ